jgi:hypothetical protein
MFLSGIIIYGQLHQVAIFATLPLIISGIAGMVSKNNFFEID